MTDTNPSPLHDFRALRQDVSVIAIRVAQLGNALDRLIAEVEDRLHVAGRAEPPIPVTPHAHHPGKQPVLVTDREQAAFVEARFGHMGYVQIAEAAAAHFGERRAVGKSAIHVHHQRIKVKRK